jgi:hypothetical protein
VARNQNLECVYFGGNKNSIAGIAMQGAEFKTTHNRISSRTLSHALLTSMRDKSDSKQDNPALSSTLSITNIDNIEEADIIIER